VSSSADWHPPRDVPPSIPWYRLLLDYGIHIAGYRRQQLNKQVNLVLQFADEATKMSDIDRQNQLRIASDALKFLGAVMPSAHLTRADWLTQRARLLGLWCASARRQLGMQAYETQIRAAIAMHDGYLVQLAPGEGKTLSIGLAAALYASAKRPCHVITANDYLAQRDAELMQALFAEAGLRVAFVVPEASHKQLQLAYAADVLYATGKQLLADFLRDRLITGAAQGTTRRRLWEMQQGDRSTKPVGRGLWAAIVDEADSVLIDEAITPLIISSSDENSLLLDAVIAGREIFQSLQSEKDFIVNLEPVPDIRFTEQGKAKIAELSFLLPAFWQFPERSQAVVTLSVLAQYVYQRDRHYLVMAEGKVVIVDETTGRIMLGRSWSHGIHQAIEAKEGLTLSNPPKTLARMTFQDYFRLYHRLSGASGTLQGIGSELRRTYGLRVLVLAPRVKSRLEVASPRMLLKADDRFQEVIEEIKRINQLGLPVLVGTRKISDTELIAAALRRLSIAHYVLNAKHHGLEAEIVKRAGISGAVTVSTNMAGRGTDILIDAMIAEQGGLQVILLEPHEAARIEWQFYGRAGRQGMRGSARSWVCLRDELLVRALGKPYRMALGIVSPILLQPVIGYALVRLAQMVAQFKAASQRKRLAKRERSVASQLSFSE